MGTLHRWLCSYVSPADFARIADLSDGFGIGRERLRSGLPGEAHSVAEFYHRCLRLLEQHGLLADPGFFAALSAERPLRTHELRLLARECGSAGMSVSPAQTMLTWTSAPKNRPFVRLWRVLTAAVLMVL